ncbi:MAG: lipopolysaccharide biosynthesis protein [Elusimicrobiota bacterium]|nr:lipopolysaccharide biosynthesis protein [Elusimicrobiota bacterium]
MGNSFKLKTFENVGYNAFGRVIAMAFQFAANIVLARNLASSDYGIAGFAMIFADFFTRFGDMGIQAAVIKERELDEKGLYTGFVIKAALGIAVFAAALVFSPSAGKLFGNPAVVNVVKFLALNFVINSFVFLPSVLLTRELDYRKLLLPQTASVVANSVISILLARAGYGYWSIILANVASTAIFAVIINIVRPVKMRFLYDRERADGFINFGGNIFVSGLIVFLIFNVDNFAIGVLKGADALGHYSVAFNWGTMIGGMVGLVILSVLFPTFSRFQEDRLRLKNAYLRVLEYVGFFGILCNSGLFMVSKEFLFLVLGRDTGKWLPALTSLRILCFYGMIRLLFEPVGSVILAMGKSGALLRVQVIVAAVELLLLYPALRFFGIEGVAAAVTLAYAVSFFALFPLLKRELKLSAAQWAAPVVPAIFSALVAAALLGSAGKYFPFSLYSLAGKIIIFTGVYCLVYGVATKWKMAGELKEIAAEFRRGR